MAQHSYEVHLTRNVERKEAGKHAFIQDRITKVFSFGSGKEYKNGRLAKEAALDYAESMINESSHVVVWKLCGGSGSGNALKSDTRSRFKTGWSEKEREHGIYEREREAGAYQQRALGADWVHGTDDPR